MIGIADGRRCPTVVVCPANLRLQWRRYLEGALPGRVTHVIGTSTPYPLVGKVKRLGLRADQRPDVLVISYHCLRGWAETLAQFTRYVVFDECQQLRNDGSAIYTACQYLAQKVPLRLGLSATPIHGYGGEFYHVVDVLRPGALGTHQEFLREWCDAYGGKYIIKDPEAFGAWLRREGIMLRRTRAEMGRELPPLTTITHEVEYDADILARVSGDAINLARTIVAHNESVRGARLRAAGEFDTLLRQATGIAKAPYVAEFVRLLLESESKIVIFAWHRAVIDILRGRLAEFAPVLITGSESEAQKDASRTAFIDGDSRVCIISLRSGIGLDGLQAACHVAVFAELDWSPAQHEQCIGRLQRDGLLEAVIAYFIIANGGMDPYVAQALGIKVEQINRVLEPQTSALQAKTDATPRLREIARAYLERHGEPVPSAGAAGLAAAACA